MSNPSKFLLLLGPSAVGKSRIMWTLRAIDGRYTYIAPYMNRTLRDGETDKVHVSDHEMDRLALANELLVINEKFGYRYATPKRPIQDAFDSGRFPLLDWPAARLHVMRQAFGDRLYVVYVLPPSLEVLAGRLQADNRDPSGVRFREAVAELDLWHSGSYESVTDLVVINYDNQADAVAGSIHTAYLRNLSVDE